MENKSNLIDVILPVFNGGKFLKEQLESIFNQTNKNFNLIVIDDCSEDNSVEIIKNFQQKYKNIQFYKNKKNLGVVKNIEKGLKISTANYIALCDQDDIWDKNKLEIEFNLIKKYNGIPILVHSDLEMIDENSKIICKSYFKFRNYNLPQKKALNKIISQNGIMGNTILMNKLLKELVLPFPKDLAVHDYWIALINELFGKRITVNKPLVKYRIHSANTSNKGILNKKFKFSKKLPYQDIKRENVLEELLNRYEILEEDEEIIRNFLKYLKLEGNILLIFYNLLKYDFLKKGFFYKFKIFLKLLCQGK